MLNQDIQSLLRSSGYTGEFGLSELIEAINPYPIKLEKRMDGRTPEGHLKFSCWRADCFDADDYWVGEGDIPEIAVANLWLSLHLVETNKEQET